MLRSATQCYAVLRSAALCVLRIGGICKAWRRRMQDAGARRCFAEWVQPKLLWLGEWLSDPQHARAPPCVLARVCACVRESSSEAWRSLCLPVRYFRCYVKQPASFCELVRASAGSEG